MNIGSAFLDLISLSESAKLISESTDARPFGNGEAIVEIGRLCIKMDTDRDDISAILFIKGSGDKGVSIYDILRTLGKKDMESRDAVTIQEFAEIINRLYSEIVSLISNEEGREMAHDVGRRANEIWMEHLRKLSSDFRQKRNK